MMHAHSPHFASASLRMSNTDPKEAVALARIEQPAARCGVESETFDHERGNGKFRVSGDWGEFHSWVIAVAVRLAMSTERASHATGDPGFAALLFISRSKSRSGHQGAPATWVR
jgi:hypothetical protein